MNSTLATRPATALATSLRASLSRLGPTPAPRRSHQSTSRTKRALRIRPHPSHVFRTAGAGSSSSPAADEIVFNPPSSQPTVYHTPFKFLPPSDPRRSNNLQLLFPNNGGAAAAGSSRPGGEEYLPPALTPTTEKKYHLTKDDVAEMRRLRWEEPGEWTLKNLSEKFKCSTAFVQIATDVSPEYKDQLALKTKRLRATWGPRKLKAREERKVRKEMLFRGEL